MTAGQRLKLGRRVVWFTQAGRRHRERDRFPLTAGWIQRVTRKMGEPVGRNRAYDIQHELIAQGYIEPAGSYPQRRGGVYTGIKIALYRLKPAALRSQKFSVPGPNRNKRPKRVWRPLSWGHSLFGMPDGLPPPGWTAAEVARRQSLDEQLAPWEAKAWA